MAHVLAIRFSALGDVAMTVPVVYSFAKAYPEHELTILSSFFCAPLFEYMPANIHFKGVDLKNYRGVSGLNKLYRELKDEKYDAVVDWHDVLRTIFLRFCFLCNNVPVAVIRKGRAEKKKLTRSLHKEMKPLKSSFTRYALALSELGFPVELEFSSIYGSKQGPFSRIESLTGKKGDSCWIGIAPFAQHKGKIYPIDSMEQVIQILADEKNIKIFLFGGGAHEREICDIWASRYPFVQSLVGNSRLEEELIVMSHLDIMLSMDSANMHLASVVGCPVISVWGATHPYTGFMGWGQNEINTVQLELPCRPCSVYGKKMCKRGDLACLTHIRPQQIVEKILHVIQ